jgi:predicted membrane protein
MKKLGSFFTQVGVLIIIWIIVGALLATPFGWPVFFLLLGWTFSYDDAQKKRQGDKFISWFKGLSSQDQDTEKEKEEEKTS